MRYIALLLIGFTQVSCMAQKGEDFDQMVDQLLDHSVPEVVVDSLTNTKMVHFLDAREGEEYQVSHISGAHWVGYNDFSIDRVKDLPKDAKIVVYCSVGYRSEKVSEQLIKAGYSNVSNLKGGIFDWVNNDKQVFNAQGLSTDTVHNYDGNWGKWLEKGVGVH